MNKFPVRMAIAAALLFGTPFVLSAKTVDFTKPDTYETPGSPYGPIYGSGEYCDPNGNNIQFCYGAEGYNYQTSFFEDFPGISLDDEGLTE